MEMWFRNSKSEAEIHRKSSKVLNSIFHIKCKVKLFISHQMKSCSSVKAIWGSIYACVTAFGLWRKSRKLGPNNPIVDTDTHKLIQCVKLHILHQMKPYSNLKTIWGLIYTCLVDLEHWSKSGNSGSNTANHEFPYTESNPKC